MEVVFNVLLVVFYLLSPLGIIYLCDRYPFFNKIGTVIIAYALGILFASANLLQTQNTDLIQEILMSIAIPLAIPLLLFSSDLKRSFFLARNTLMSLFAALISVVTAVVIGYVWFNHENSDDFHKIGGLLVGVYTGGTPNLAALKMILDVKPDTYVAIHAYDMVLSTIHLFFLMILGKRIFEMILPVFKKKNGHGGNIKYKEDLNEPYWGLLNKEYFLPHIKSLVVTVLIVAIAGAIMLLVNEKSKMVVFILSITTISICTSFINTIKNIPKTFELGMYFILVFSVVVASKVQYEHFTNINSVLFGYISFVVFGSMFLHVVISMFFKIDADTVIITSAALICSPPFVPVVAGSLKNREIILPGITVGIIGYAIGNYLGYIISELLMIL